MTNDNWFNQVALSSKEGLYLPHKSEYITFVGHPSQQLQHPYWHHINTQSEGSLSYLWEIPLLTALRHPHWHQYLLVWGYLYPNCIHTGNTSIFKMHPYGNTSISKMYLYWQHINTLTASILASIPKLHSYWQHINTQNSSMLAAHQYPKYIHIVITSIPKMHPYRHHINTQRKGNLGLNLCIIGDPNATCSISFNPTPPCCRAAVKGERD